MRDSIIVKNTAERCVMPKKAIIPTMIEHKFFNASFPSPQRGVKFNWCYQNNTTFHEHDFYEFVVVTDGKVKHLHNSKTCIATKGMLFLIKPGEFHQFLPYHNGPAKHINFSITPQVLSEISSTIWQENILQKIIEWNIPNDLFLPESDFEFILNSIERLNQFSSQPQGSYPIIKNIILELLIFLTYKLETTKEQASFQARPAWLNTFLEKLDNPNVFTMKLKDIYPLAPYSQSMLNTYFNKYVGTTLISYITKLKINYACTLLRYTDSSPLDISSRLAYDSLSHFNRVFKKITGMSPIQYRREITLTDNA